MRLAIYAKGIEHEIAIVSPPNDLGSEEFRSINPLGKIPVLQGEGWFLPESSVINEFLEERFPSPPLLPTDVEARARARLLVRLVDTYAYPAVFRLYAHTKPESRSEEAIPAETLAVESALGYLENWIDREPNDHDAQDHDAQDHGLTLADCAVVPLLFSVRAASRLLGLELLAGHPRVAAYFERVSATPPAVRVLEELRLALEERRRELSSRE